MSKTKALIWAVLWTIASFLTIAASLGANIQLHDLNPNLIYLTYPTAVAAGALAYWMCRSRS